MTSHELNDIYFDWMQQLVCDDEFIGDRSFYKLFRLMDETPYDYILPMDGNRAEDGADLRYRFGYELGIDPRIIASELDYQPCSILEMLVALVCRCEDHIMVDLEVGHQYGRWFWKILNNLGLDEMDDTAFDYEKAKDILENFLYRNYEPDGRGGPVYLPDCGEDLRCVDIWGQMMRYLSSIMA